MSPKSVLLAAGAASAFTLAALIEIVASLLRHEQTPLRLTGMGMAAVAILWWVVYFQWKRKIER